MKMAIQYWHGRGVTGRQRFLTIRNGYHGDTFGAMSVCDPVNGMHHLFNGVLTEQLFAPAPSIRPEESWDDREMAAFAALIGQHATEIAAVILVSEETIVGIVTEADFLRRFLDESADVPEECRQQPVARHKAD